MKNGIRTGLLALFHQTGIQRNLLIKNGGR